MPTSKSAVKTFKGLLEPTHLVPNSTFVRIPFDIEKAWPERRGRQVKGEVNGFPFRTTLFPTREGPVLLVNRKMLKGAGVRQGEKAEIRLEPDLEEREAKLPKELLAGLRGEKRFQKWFEKLPPSFRKQMGQFIAEPKSAASRQKRADDMLERLYLAMEGETEAPPILRVAFQRQPLAEAGWHALTAAQRRNHLLGIFYYRTAEARENRAAVAIADALKAAKRIRGSSESET